MIMTNYIIKIVSSHGRAQTFVEKTISITLIKLCKPMISCLIQELENVKD